MDEDGGRGWLTKKVGGVKGGGLVVEARRV